MKYPGLVYEDHFNTQERTEQLGGVVGGGTYANQRYSVSQSGAKDKIDYTVPLSKLMERLWLQGEFSLRLKFKVTGGTTDLHNKIIQLANAAGWNFTININYTTYSSVNISHYTDSSIHSAATSLSGYAGEWVDVLMTHKDGEGYGTFYVDGEAVSPSGSAILGFSTYEISNGKLDAEYDILQVFDRQLTANEINYLHNINNIEIPEPIFSWNENGSGTLIDSVSGVAANLTAGDGGFVQTEKGWGLKCDGSATDVNFGDIVSFGANDFTIEVSFIFNGSLGTDLIVKRNGTGPDKDGFMINIGSGGNIFAEIDPIGAINIGVGGTTIMQVGQSYHAVLMRDGNTLRIFLNNIEEGTVDITGVGSIDNSLDLFIGSNNGISRFSGNTIFLAKIFNEAIPQSALNKLYSNFLNASHINYPKRPTYPDDGAIHPVLVETFADTAVGTFPKGWIKGTGEYEVDELTTADPVLSDLTTGTKLLKCTTSGTAACPFNGATDVDAKMDYFDGSTWETLEDTLDNLISTHSWLSLTNDHLEFNLTQDDAVTNIIIYSGKAVV